MCTGSRTAFPAYIRSAVTKCERCVSYAATIPKTPTSSFPSAAGQSVLLVSTASSSASARLPTCHSRSTHTCCAMPAALSSPMMATTRGRYSTTSGTRTSSTRCATPKWRLTASRIFGANRRRQARDDFLFPFNHPGIRASFPLRQHFLDQRQRPLELLVGHRFHPAGLLDLHLARNQ